MRFVGLVAIILAFIWAYKLRPRKKVEPTVATVILVEEAPQSVIQKKTQPILQAQKFLASYSQQHEDTYLDIHPELEDELFDILQQLDSEHAENIFHEYQEEKRKHRGELSLNMNVEVMNLSMLNGESIDWEEIEERNQHSSNLNMLEINHQERMKNILGDHFEYIQNQLSAQNYR